jgi:TonB family protein
MGGTKDVEVQGDLTRVAFSLERIGAFLGDTRRHLSKSKEAHLGLSDASRALARERQQFQWELAALRARIAEARDRRLEDTPHQQAPPATPNPRRSLWVPALAASLAMHFLGTWTGRPPAVHQDAIASPDRVPLLVQLVSVPELPPPSVARPIPPGIRSSPENRPPLDGPKVKRSQAAATQAKADNAVLFVRAPEGIPAKPDKSALAISDRSIQAQALLRSPTQPRLGGAKIEGPGHKETDSLAGSHELGTGPGLDPYPNPAVVAGFDSDLAPGISQDVEDAEGHLAAQSHGNSTTPTAQREGNKGTKEAFPLATNGNSAVSAAGTPASGRARKWGQSLARLAPGFARDFRPDHGRRFRLRGRAWAVNAWAANPSPAPRPYQPGEPRDSAPGSPASPPAAVMPEIVALGKTSQVPTRETSLGRYLVGVDQDVRMSWVMPLEMRALGVQGTSEVTFIVDSKGRVQEKHLTRRSGRTELDALALAAVPKRLDRMPDDLRLEFLTVRYTFRTTDTLIAGSR